MNKQKINEYLDALIQSCNEGIDGTWDVSCLEGRESFQDMIDLLDYIKLEINKGE